MHYAPPHEMVWLWSLANLLAYLCVHVCVHQTGTFILNPLSVLC